MRTHPLHLFPKLILLSIVMILPMACSLITSNSKNPTAVPTQPFLPTPYIVTATPFPTSAAQPTAFPTNSPYATAAPRVSSAPCPIPGGWAPYYVASGDTLNAIARRAGTTADQLAAGNCLPNQNTIYAGQLLYTPPMFIPTNTPAQVVCSMTPRLVAGSMGHVTPGLPNTVRSAPGTGSNSAAIGQIPAGEFFTVISGPQCAGGIYWWQVNYNGLTGWTGEGQNGTYWVEPYIPATMCSPTPRLVIGGQGQVTAGTPNAIRSAPGTGADSLVIAQIPGGGVFTVLNGPQCSGGIYWWQINYNGTIGWTGEGQGAAYWVTPYATTTCAPAPRLVAGGQGRVLAGDPNAVRSAPGISSSSVVIGQIPAGSVFLVITGPQCANGIYWWQVNYNGLIGWTGEGQGTTYWVEPYTPASCAPAPRLTVGGQGQVTPGQPNTFRATPSFNGSAIGQIPGGAIFTVLNGPQCAEGSYWWQVNYNGTVGWTAEGQGTTYWAVPYTPTACTLSPRLLVGYSGQVLPGTPNAIRNAPGTSSGSVVTGQIPGGAAFRVLSGPQCADGYNWWQVNYNGLVGWTPEGQGTTYWTELLMCGNSVVSRLATNMNGQVTPGTPNRLRTNPGNTNPVIGEIPGGAIFSIIGGPQCGGEGWVWWQVNYNGTVGWTAEGDNATYWLQPAS